MAYPSIQIANELLSSHGDVSHMKLQKLLYYANGWWLATSGVPLVNERPQVWRYGPVYQYLYRIFSRFGHANIGGPVPASPFSNEPELLGNTPDEVRVRQLLEWVWAEHGTKTAVHLSDETHAQGTPWRQIAEEHKFRVPFEVEISPQQDWEFFAKLAQQRGIQTVPLAT